MDPTNSRRNEVAPGATAIPSLPSEPADRLYWLEGQLFVAIPFSRYQALMGGHQPPHSSRTSPPSRDTSTPVQNPAASISAQGPPAPTTSCAHSPASTIEPNSMVDNPRARARVTVACVNCHGMRKSCDSVRPCQRCVRRGIGASCIDHTRAPRRSFTGQSESNNSLAMSPALEDTVSFIGDEGVGGGSGQNVPLFSLQFPSFPFEDTAAAVMGRNMDTNELWGSY